MTNTELLKSLIREEIKKALIKSSLTEAFASPILQRLLKGDLRKMHTGYTKEIAQAFYNMSKVALDKVVDSDIQRMDPSLAYKTLKKNGGENLIVFYMSEKGGKNPYAKDSYSGTIPPNTLLGIASGDNKFYSIDYPRYSAKPAPEMKQGTGDNLGVQKTGSGWGSTGLYNVKRVSEVADVAYVIDLSKLQATKSTKEKIELRTTQKSGATAFMTAKQFKQDNINRYNAILASKVVNTGPDVISKQIQDVIQTISADIAHAVGSMTIGKYSRIIVGKDPKGREVTAADASNFIRNMLDNFERYIDCLNEAAKESIDDNYYKKSAAKYALTIKNLINKANNMDYAW